MEAFNDIFEDCTSLGTKIPKDNYLSEGKYIVVDQGQNIIAGYTNEEDGLYEDVPAIVFGDHTRIIKYVDEPFFLGADGVKLLKSKKKDANYKYLYYALKNARIPDTGYNRHFKWLKEVNIEYPEPDKQQKIVEVLDKISRVIEERKLELQQLDELIKARFVELFYDKGYPVLGWNDVFNTTTGKLDSNAMVEGGEYPFFTCAKDIFRIDKYAFDQEALLLAGNNAAGKYDVKYYKGKFNAYQRTYVLGLKQDWSYRLFQYQLEDKLVYLQQQSLGGLTKYLTMKILGDLSFIIPPMEKQTEFESFVKQVDKSKVAVQKALDEAQLLFDSLMQDYFG
ncbi:restriction endonuclease subunit S [Lachnobacterium bovis]|uniref:Type I restriction enzyme, S subunit n=1 Tax=Lachnobacterium bovis DSM 14045 TaxID=1122142 RepID=A0A1H3L7M2_9FIRM|nr:restriction endonuclease subunit S [Lachnobacterium bovis]SDY60423.1 type I restriction enzyme, S subunit [Lachnobacterium bovis DSM 14045]